MEHKFVLVSDFDGTISKKDFFAYATENILSYEDMYPWREYKKGKISHVNALNLIFNQIHLPKSEFDLFIDSIEVEEYFCPTVELCKNKNIDVFVVSAGADYYISRILKRLCVEEKVSLITNPSTYSQIEGLKLFPVDKSHRYYDEDLGVSKKNFVLNLKQKGYTVIFAGDGLPDIDAAKVSDIVFARDYLVQLCEKNRVSHKHFDSYYDIFNFISNC